MSFLISDSLTDIIDPKAFEEEEGFDVIGRIEISGKTYVIDGFMSDRKSFRVYADGSATEAVSLLSLKENETVRIVLGDEAFVAKGSLVQVGYESLPQGGRIIISMIVRDK
jgi:hypothetical protein